MYSAVVAFTLAGHCLQFAASTCPTSNTALKVSLFSGDTFTCVGLLCPHRGHGSQRHEEQTQNLRGLSRFPYCLLHQLYAKLPDLRYMGVITWHCRRSSWTPEPHQSTAKGIPRSPSLPQRASAHFRRSPLRLHGVYCRFRLAIQPPPPPALAVRVSVPNPEHLPPPLLGRFLYPLPFSRQLLGRLGHLTSDHRRNAGATATVFPVLHLASGFLRPSKYLEPCPSPRERPGNTKTGYLLGLGYLFREGWGLIVNPDQPGWGLSPPCSRQVTVFCIFVAALREEWDSVLARWTARARHPGAT